MGHWALKPAHLHNRVLKEGLVRVKGLEPSHELYRNLNPARLPIPPHPHPPPLLGQGRI